MATKRITKKEKRRIFLLTILALVLTSFIAYNLFSIWNQTLGMKKQKVFLAKQLQDMKDEEQYLKTEVEKLQDPDYIARYAREKYLYSKDGEFNIRIPWYFTNTYDIMCLQLKELLLRTAEVETFDAVATL